MKGDWGRTREEQRRRDLSRGYTRIARIAAEHDRLAGIVTEYDDYNSFAAQITRMAFAEARHRAHGRR